MERAKLVLQGPRQVLHVGLRSVMEQADQRVLGLAVDRDEHRVLGHRVERHVVSERAVEAADAAEVRGDILDADLGALGLRDEGLKARCGLRPGHAAVLRASAATDSRMSLSSTSLPRHVHPARLRRAKSSRRLSKLGNIRSSASCSDSGFSL